MDLIIEWRDIYGVTTVVLAAGLLAGGLFGWLAERSDYCARSAYDELFLATSNRANSNFGAIKSASKDRAPFNQLWQVSIAALSAIIAVSLLSQMELISLGG
ncbi:MAG: hypothetical protein ACO2ZQ_08150, partial [Candidatus Puniceispirillaceae bacterium]